MPVYLFKSILSLFIVVLTAVAMFTMFEVYGRAEGQRKFDASRLKTVHRINGYLFLVLSLYIANLCIEIMRSMHGGLSARAVVHSTLAWTVFLLLMLKILFRRVYRQYYGHIRYIGLVMAIVVLVMFGTSGGYYLTVTKFGTDMRLNKAISGMDDQTPRSTAADEPDLEHFVIREDPISINRGKALYEENCSGCHDPLSNETVVGPGHKGILKHEKLPVSHKPATADNVYNQIVNPYMMMPQFDDLTEDEIQNIIAYLGTL